MKRSVYLLFGIVAYLIFFMTFLYLIAFVGDLPVASRTVDRGGLPADFWTAAVINVGLVALFGLQHSLMARRSFKLLWTQIVPKPIERSLYVLATSLVLILLYSWWRPLPALVWEVTNPVGTAILSVLFWCGWLLVLTSTFLISHFELFGLQQVWGHMRGRTAAEPVFRQPLFYRFVRHPIYLGFMVAFWATPHMTVGHLLLALAMSVYMLIAIRFEERDLVRLFGRRYEDYRLRVGMLAPRLRRG